MDTERMQTPPPTQAGDRERQDDTCHKCPPATSGGDKAKRNFWVDVATAFVFAAMLSTGILLEWVLVPGRFGGRGLTWLGLDRHAWGDVHFWLAVALVGLIVAHVVLHWTWVKACWKRCLGSARSVRTWVAVALLATLVALPLLIPPGHGTNGRGRGFGRGAGWQPWTHDGSSAVQRPAAGRGHGRGWRGGPTEEGDRRGWGTELWEGDFGP